MRKQVMEFLEKLETVVIEDQPAVKVLLGIKAFLTERGMPPAMINSCLLGLNLEISGDFVNDEELFQETVESYGKFLIRAFDFCKANGLPFEVFTKDLHLTYT